MTEPLKRWDELDLWDQSTASIRAEELFEFVRMVAEGEAGLEGERVPQVARSLIAALLYREPPSYASQHCTWSQRNPPGTRTLHVQVDGWVPSEWVPSDAELVEKLRAEFRKREKRPQ